MWIPGQWERQIQDGEQLQETPVQELEDYEQESEWETWPCE
jgi:hypothetical protein